MKFILNWFKNNSRAILSLVILIVFWIIFYYEIWTQKRYIAWDLDGYNYPLDKFLFDSLKNNHEIPQYDPYIYNGMDFIGNIQAAIFYLPKLLMIGFLILVNKDLSYTVYILFCLLHVLIFSVLLYFLIKKFTNSYTLSVFGALMIAYSGFMQAQMQHFYFYSVIAWTPLVALGLYKFIIEKKKSGFFIYVVFSSFMFLGGFPQLFIALQLILFLFLFLYLLSEKDFKQIKNFLLKYFIANIFVIGLCALQILPFVNLFRTSAAKSIGYYTEPLKPKSLFTFIYPDQFGHLSGDFVVAWERTNTYYFLGPIFILSAILFIYLAYKKQLDKKLIGISFSLITLTGLLTYTEILRKLSSLTKLVDLFRPAMLAYAFYFLICFVIIYLLYELIKNLQVNNYIIYTVLGISTLSLFFNNPGFYNSIPGNVKNIKEIYINFGGDEVHSKIKADGTKYSIFVDQEGLGGFFDNWPRIFQIRSVSGHDPLARQDYLDTLVEAGGMRISGKRIELTELPDFNWLKENGVKYYMVAKDKFSGENYTQNGLTQIFANDIYEVYEFDEPKETFTSDCATINNYTIEPNEIKLSYSNAMVDCTIRSTMNINTNWRISNEELNIDRLENNLGYEINLEASEGAIILNYKNADYKLGAFISLITFIIFVSYGLFTYKNLAKKPFNSFKHRFR